MAIESRLYHILKQQYGLYQTCFSIDAYKKGRNETRQEEFVH